MLMLIVIVIVHCVYGSFAQPNPFFGQQLFNRLPDEQPHLFSEFKRWLQQNELKKYIYNHARTRCHTQWQRHGTDENS